MSDIAQARVSVRADKSHARFGAGDLSREDAAQNMSAILAAKGLSARLTVGDRSFIVGKSPKAGEEVVELVFKSHRTFDRLMANVRLYAFAKAYFDEELDILGSFGEAVEVFYAINIVSDRPQNLWEQVRSFAFRVVKAAIPFVAMRFGSNAHYSMDANAYRLFLDEYMQYTCGKFMRSDDGLNEAQINKFQLIERLATPYIGNLAGIKHLDIGCGWGGLISYFQKHFFTKSIGNTNSESQETYAQEHYGARILRDDFSKLQQLHEQYDLVTVIGMIEHLTPRRRSQLLRVIDGCLKQDGLVYLQCIGKPDVWIGGDAYRIAYEDVFPGHYLESRGEMEARFREFGFEVLYSADDAIDYARTTALWAKNLQLKRQEVVDFIGERNFRIFLGYLSYGSKLFSSGRGSLMRYMLRKYR
jgi:cyclopropane fatty-acyl-phospholipid synthase-like methyltransferase